MSSRTASILISIVLAGLVAVLCLLAELDTPEPEPTPEPPEIAEAGILPAPVEPEPPEITEAGVRPLPAPTPEPTPEPEPEPEIVVDDWAAQLIARTIWGEGRGLSPIERAGIAWCILNRVDAEGWAMGHSVEHVVTFPEQFHGYSPHNPLDPELYEQAVDVLTRWEREKRGETDVGRVLPPEFLWFHGDGQHNYFRNAYDGSYATWDWSLPDPYTEKEITP